MLSQMTSLCLVVCRKALGTNCPGRPQGICIPKCDCNLPLTLSGSVCMMTEPHQVNENWTSLAEVIKLN